MKCPWSILVYIHKKMPWSLIKFFIVRQVVLHAIFSLSFWIIAFAFVLFRFHRTLIRFPKFSVIDDPWADTQRFSYFALVKLTSASRKFTSDVGVFFPLLEIPRMKYERKLKIDTFRSLVIVISHVNLVEKSLITGIDRWNIINLMHMLASCQCDRCSWYIVRQQPNYRYAVRRRCCSLSNPQWNWIKA